MQKEKIFDQVTQFAIPGLTVAATVVIAMKMPQWGLFLNLASQPFWLYSSWKAYKKAGQIGILITTVIMIIVISFGLVNYWIIK
ncbi:MAG: hypothetical protein PHP25_01915 [Candidatus Moranbacteria bacterium]|nr:hypothetical protein [Candidatus Moranbacteria bacterium]